ncbi:hypothetical protein FKM82_020500 [Ascaphus truei]
MENPNSIVMTGIRLLHFPPIVIHNFYKDGLYRPILQSVQDVMHKYIPVCTPSLYHRTYFILPYVSSVTKLNLQVFKDCISEPGISLVLDLLHYWLWHVWKLISMRLPVSRRNGSVCPT